MQQKEYFLRKITLKNLYKKLKVLEYNKMLKIKNHYYCKKEKKSIKNNSKNALYMYEKSAKKKILFFYKFKLLFRQILEKYISINQLVLMIELLFLLLFHLFYLFHTYQIK